MTRSKNVDLEVESLEENSNSSKVQLVVEKTDSFLSQPKE